MRKLLWICLLLIASIAAKSQEQSEFTVLQWNIWQEGTKVTGGYDAIVDEIIRLKPDFVTFSEVRNYNNTRFCDRIVQSLKAKGETYYSFYSYDSGLLSRHPITDSLTIFPEKDDHGSIYKMTSKIKGHKIAVYTAHLDYLNDAYYNVRGYDGSTWEEIPVPQTVLEVLKVNDACAARKSFSKSARLAMLGKLIANTFQEALILLRLFLDRGLCRSKTLLIFSKFKLIGKLKRNPLNFLVKKTYLQAFLQQLRQQSYYDYQ